MAMAGKIRFTFHTRVFLTLLAICWILVGTSMAFQYHREKDFKTHLLNTRLQMHNMRILEDLDDGQRIEDIISRIGSPVDELRITLIDRDGTVIFDNNDRTPFPTANHNSRPEVISARTGGEGYAVERMSESDAISYFYSARLGEEGLVIRSAVPYSHSLYEFLQADRTMIWIMAGLTILMSYIGFLATRRISLSIERLSMFAEKAEKGERIYSGETFPHDELGNIASNIVKLYAQRDEQHKEALRLEQDKIRIKKQLTNNINHELKTPVASIIVSLDILKDHPEISERKKREYMERIRANADRLTSLLNDVSTITRLDEGSEFFEMRDIDLTALLMEVIEEERLKTDILISAELPELRIHGNRHLLESIFRNLIENAILYSGATTLLIKADKDGNFEVSDNGCGISPEHLPHIFERFYRIDEGRSRAAGGTGLGLSIVKNSVAKHGGDITAQSGNGLTFHFNLAVMKTS